MLEKFIKNDAQLENMRKVMYLVITCFICYFFVDIHIQSNNIVKKEIDSKIKIPDYNNVDIDYSYYYATPSVEYDYYGIYVRKIAYDVVQIIFLIALIMQISIVAMIKNGKYNKA